MQLIVLGMHRSGTSSVTRLLNLAGAYFGPEGIATDANEENPKGFWERRDVRDVCDGLLEDGGFDWWRVADFDVDRVPEAARQERVDEFRRIVLQLDAHRPWVVKEPRLCLLLPILRATLEAPVFIHVAREPLEIAESLAARNGFPIPFGLALWETYTVSAHAATAGEQNVLVSYGDLIDDPVGTTHLLVEQLSDLGVHGLHVPADREITSFVSSDLRRQRRHARDREGYLNEHQTALARAVDERRVPEILSRSISAGAAATLRTFEESQARAGDLEAQLADAAADLRSAEAAHREIVDAMTSALQEREVAHQQLEEAHRKTEATLRAVAEESAEASRVAERRAVESLAVAARAVRSLKRSGSVRLGARLSTLRDVLRGRPRGGVYSAIQGTLKQIDQARVVLEDHLDSDPLLARGAVTSEPPPVEELRSSRRDARARGDRIKVAVIAWDLGHNPFGRAHLLADLLQDRFEVELWGSQFKRYGVGIWPPLRDTTIPVKRLRGATFPEFLETMEDAARRIEADVIYVSKPRLPSLALGIMAKELWNRPLILDVDDFEPSFFAETAGLSTDELWERRRDPDLALPFGRLWTRACESVVRATDQVTVSNLELEARYGGIVVPHARDESVFDPARYDRSAARRRLGLRDADKLVLFGGTPRVHKGIVQLLEALETLGDEHIRVGVFGTPELDDLRDQIAPLKHWILPLPYHAFDDLPSLLAATDLACALQAPDHPVSRYQMPAKVTDAMAMGVPCLVTAVPPLQPLIDKDVVEVFDGDWPLHERIRGIFHHAEETADRARRAREVFLESYSYLAVRPIVASAVEGLLDDPPPMTKALSSLVNVGRDLYRPAAPGRSPATIGAMAPIPAVPRRRVPAGSTYDLVVFWKQNDTGIYGRRQDMFLKYLERSGRFNQIVHFDQPMSADELLRVARRSVGSDDQNRLVLTQTLRRLVHRSDHGAVRQRTFLYTSGPIARALRLPRRDRYADFVRQVLEREGIGRRRPVMCWVYPTNPLFPALADALRPDVVVADVVDDNRTWYAPGTPPYDRLSRNYAEVLARSDVILANCEPVAASMRSFAARVDVVPNACELPGDAPRGDRPQALAGLRGPIIGYAGNLSDRIDIQLLRQLVRARRDWSFVFIGSTHLDRSALQLAEEPNVRFIGTKRYDEARSIISHFDVALIPHVDNDMTRSMNPLKAYVYVSLGIPIVSTSVAGLDELAEFITTAEGPDEFTTAIETALECGRQVPDSDTLVPHSWEARVAQVLDLIDEVVTARPAESE